MSGLSALRTVEEAIFEVFTWVVLWPKTLVVLLRRPSAADTIVQDEAAASPRPFTATLHPLLFLVLTQMAIFAATERFELPSRTLLWSAVADLGPTGAGLELRLTLVAVASLVPVMSYSTLLAALKREPLDTDHLRPHVLKHAYTVTVLVIGIWLVTLFRDVEGLIVGLSLLGMGLWLIIWFFVAETIIFSKSLGVTRLRGFMWSVCGYIFAGILLHSLVGIARGRSPW